MANTNNIVNNKAKPSLERLNEIAYKLECPITDLFEKPTKKGDNEFKCPNCGTSLEIKGK